MQEMTGTSCTRFARPLVLATTLAVLAGCGRTGDDSTGVPSGTSSAPPGSVTTSPPSVRIGPLTFMREDADGNWQTWVACGDLAEATQVTDVSARDSAYPVWSPDGSRIAFDSNRDDPNPDDDTAINDVFTMEPDGSGVIRLTDGVGTSTDPDYSPDGSLIAFASDRGRYPEKQGIYVMNAADGGHVRRVTSLPPAVSVDYAPRFSPDGTHLVFTREVDEASGDAALYVVNLDGSGLLGSHPATSTPVTPTGRPTVRGSSSRSCSPVRECVDRGLRRVGASQRDGDGLRRIR